MLTGVKFNSFTAEAWRGTFNFDADTLKLMLTLVTPVVGNTVKANLTEIAAGGGYTAGGEDVGVVLTAVGGVATITGDEIQWIGSGGGMAPFQFLALYDDTPTSPLDPLMFFWDNLVPITLAAGESFLGRFNDGSPTGTIATST
jgi:hypothetical protein